MTSPSPFRPGLRPQVGDVHSGAGVIPGPPAPVEIPLCWFTQPVALRMERPFTTAAVTQTGVGTSYASAGAVSDFPFTATLSSATTGSAQRLADFTIAYRSQALMRSPVLILDLMHRAPAEIVMLQRIERNQRITITGIQPEYPQGAQHLIVSGITHVIGINTRRIQWTTRPVIGTAPGVSGPWFYPGASAWGGSDGFLP